MVNNAGKVSFVSTGLRLSHNRRLRCSLSTRYNGATSSRMTRGLSNYDDHCYENVTENYLFMFFQTLSLLFSLTQYLKCPTDDEFFRNVSRMKTGNGKLLSSMLTSSTQHRLWKFHVVIVQWTFKTKNFDTAAELLCSNTTTFSSPFVCLISHCSWLCEVI